MYNLASYFVMEILFVLNIEKINRSEITSCQTTTNAHIRTHLYMHTCTHWNSTDSRRNHSKRSSIISLNGDKKKYSKSKGETRSQQKQAPNDTNFIRYFYNFSYIPSFIPFRYAVVGVNILASFFPKILLFLILFFFRILVMYFWFIISFVFVLTTFLEIEIVGWETEKEK